MKIPFYWKMFEIRFANWCKWSAIVAWPTANIVGSCRVDKVGSSSMASRRSSSLSAGGGWPRPRSFRVSSPSLNRWNHSLQAISSFSKTFQDWTMALPDTFSLFEIVEQAHPNSVLLIFHSKKSQNYKVVNFYKNIELEKIYNSKIKQKSDAKLPATPKKLQSKLRVFSFRTP